MMSPVLEPILSLLALSMIALLISGGYTMLKGHSFRSFGQLAFLNIGCLLMIQLIDISAKRLSGCPRLIGECYNEAYDSWHMMVVLLSSGLWMPLNLLLSIAIVYLLLKRYFKYIYARLRTHG